MCPLLVLLDGDVSGATPISLEGSPAQAPSTHVGGLPPTPPRMQEASPPPDHQGHTAWAVTRGHVPRPRPVQMPRLRPPNGAGTPTELRFLPACPRSAGPSAAPRLALSPRGPPLTLDRSTWYLRPSSSKDSLWSSCGGGGGRRACGSEAGGALGAQGEGRAPRLGTPSPRPHHGHLLLQLVQLLLLLLLLAAPILRGGGRGRVLTSGLREGRGVRGATAAAPRPRAAHSGGWGQ